MFDSEGTPRIDKQPIAAWNDTAFASAARTLTSTTFVAHVRHASTGAHTVANTHPFEQAGRLFAHNGVVAGLTDVDRRLVELGAAALVSGQTDSERVFALITAEIARHGGDVTAGLVAAISWISEHLPVYSLNVVLSTATELWALRYPEANELWVLQRPAGRSGSGQPLDAQTDRIHVRSTSLAGASSVIIASEPMDDDRRWRLLSSGELLHIAEDLTVTASTSFPDPPAHQLRMSDLAATAAASQQATP